MRTKAYGQDGSCSPIDKFGFYLSFRKCLKYVKNISSPIQCLDIGCGYSATLLRGLSHYFDEGIGVDVALSKDLKNCKNLRFIEGSIENIFCDQLKEKFLNLILMNSVLEHLADPIVVLEQCYEHLKEEGLLLVNVPTWLGKGFLEFSAFKLK